MTAVGGILTVVEECAGLSTGWSVLQDLLPAHRISFVQASEWEDHLRATIPAAALFKDALSSFQECS